MRDSLDDHLNTLRDAAPGHIPPVTDHSGFEIKVHKPLAVRGLDCLYGVQMPASWERPARFGTRTELLRERAAAMRPHASYDVDGDGFVGQLDMAVAKKHDLGSGGQLTGGQRDSAIADHCAQVGSKLHDDEIGGNARARRIFTSLRESPELHDTACRQQRLRQANMAVASLRMKSSHQLKSCLRFPEPRADAADHAAPVTTRTMLLQQRAREKAAAETAGRDAFLQSVGASSSWG